MFVGCQQGGGEGPAAAAARADDGDVGGVVGHDELTMRRRRDMRLEDILERLKPPVEPGIYST